VKFDDFGIDWIDSNPQPKPPAAQQPTAAASPPAVVAQPEAPPVTWRARDVSGAVGAARKQFAQRYGEVEGPRLVTAHPDFSDHPGVVYDAHGRPVGATADGLDEQARGELAGLPDYGGPGFGANRRNVKQIHQDAAQRAAAARQSASQGQAERDTLAGAQGREDLNWGHVRRAAQSGQNLATVVTGEHRKPGQ
jgi:hypothetical protein